MILLYFITCIFASNTDANILVGRIVYESFLDINSLLFLIESQNMNLSQSKNLINKTIFPVREYLLRLKKNTNDPANVRPLKDIILDKLITFNSSKPLLQVEGNNKRENVLIKAKDNKLMDNKINNDEYNTTQNSLLDDNDVNNESNVTTSRFFGLNGFSLNKKLQNSVNTRYNLFKDDKSNIARNLYNRSLSDIIADLKLTQPIEFEKSYNNVDINNDYITMIEYLHNQIMENKMLVKVLKRERDSFYSKYKLSKNEYKNIAELRMKLSLSGSIISPGVLLNIFKNIHLEDSNKLIDKILDPIEILLKNIKAKSDSEKKYYLLTFLNSCLKRENNFLRQSIDEAFKIRTFLIQTLIKNMSSLKQTPDNIFSEFDKYQQQEINNLIKEVEKVPEKDFKKLIFLTDAVKEQYLKYLESDSKEEKEKLKKMFNLK